MRRLPRTDDIGYHSYHHDRRTHDYGNRHGPNDARRTPPHRLLFSRSVAAVSAVGPLTGRWIRHRATVSSRGCDQMPVPLATAVPSKRERGARRS